jgi:hypothetical protein
MAEAVATEMMERRAVPGRIVLAIEEAMQV